METKQTMGFSVAVYDDHAEVLKLLNKEIECVEIPAEIDGVPVTVIGNGCFSNCRDIKEMHIPDSIKKIGAGAFAFCKGVRELVIPDSVEEIGHHAFGDCKGLKRAVISRNVKTLPHGAFAFCYLSGDSEIVLQEGLERIEKNAFWYAFGSVLKIPHSVKEIGVGAFHFGPKPDTILPYDKGWDLEWPYGETVITAGEEGRITDIFYMQGSCMFLEISTDKGVKQCFYPCDILEDRVLFKDEKNKQRMACEIEDMWKTGHLLRNAFQLRDAWKRGLIAGPENRS